MPSGYLPDPQSDYGKDLRWMLQGDLPAGWQVMIHPVEDDIGISAGPLVNGEINKKITVLPDWPVTLRGIVANLLAPWLSTTSASKHHINTDCPNGVNWVDGIRIAYVFSHHNVPFPAGFVMLELEDE